MTMPHVLRAVVPAEPAPAGIAGGLPGSRIQGCNEAIHVMAGLITVTHSAKPIPDKVCNGHGVEMKLILLSY